MGPWSEPPQTASQDATIPAPLYRCIDFVAAFEARNIVGGMAPVTETVPNANPSI